MIDDGIVAITWDEEKNGVRPFASDGILDYLTSRTRVKEVESRTKYDKVFYELATESIEAKTTFKNLRESKENDDKEALKVFKADDEKMKLVKVDSMINNMKEQISSFKNKAQKITNSKAFTTEEAKNEALNKLYEERNDFMQLSVEKINKRLGRDK
jgi:hypothetical protein